MSPATALRAPSPHERLPRIAPTCRGRAEFPCSGGHAHETLRIVEQPRHGAVAFDGTTAVYRAWDNYVGTDSFTYAAGDNKSNSNLGTVTIDVQARACAGSSSTFGFGCARADGSVPSIHLDGCAVSGQQVGIVVDDAPLTGWAILALGVGRGTTELGADGCALRVGTVLAATPLLGLVNG